MSQFLFGFLVGIILTCFVLNIVLDSSKDIIKHIIKSFFRFHYNNIKEQKRYIENNKKSIKEIKEFLIEVSK